jgi:hypothetical protein
MSICCVSFITCSSCFQIMYNIDVRTNKNQYSELTAEVNAVRYDFAFFRYSHFLVTIPFKLRKHIVGSKRMFGL